MQFHEYIRYLGYGKSEVASTPDHPKNRSSDNLLIIYLIFSNYFSFYFQHSIQDLFIRNLSLYPAELRGRSRDVAQCRRKMQLGS